MHPSDVSDAFPQSVNEAARRPNATFRVTPRLEECFRKIVRTKQGMNVCFSFHPDPPGEEDVLLMLDDESRCPMPSLWQSTD
jgi:hypothetical protein